MTITHLLRQVDTLTALEILQRADVLFVDRCGRHFGGELSSEEVEILTPKRNVK
jgi:hypothetical protein